MIAFVIPEMVAIRSEGDLDKATRELCGLISLGAGISSTDKKRVRALTDAIESYERFHHPIQEPSHAAMLEHLMDAKGVDLAKLAKATKLPSDIVLSILRGSRKIKRTESEVLARYFHVEESVFHETPFVTMYIKDGKVYNAFIPAAIGPERVLVYGKTFKINQYVQIVQAKTVEEAIGCKPDMDVLDTESDQPIIIDKSAK